MIIEDKRIHGGFVNKIKATTIIYTIQNEKGITKNLKVKLCKKETVIYAVNRWRRRKSKKRTDASNRNYVFEKNQRNKDKE